MLPLKSLLRPFTDLVRNGTLQGLGHVEQTIAEGGCLINAGLHITDAKKQPHLCMIQTRQRLRQHDLVCLVMVLELLLTGKMAVFVSVVRLNSSCGAHLQSPIHLSRLNTSSSSLNSSFGPSCYCWYNRSGQR